MIAEDQVRILLKSITEGFRVKAVSTYNSENLSLKSLLIKCIDDNGSDFKLIQDIKVHVQLTKESIDNIVTKSLEETPLLTLTSEDIPILQELRRNLNVLNR